MPYLIDGHNLIGKLPGLSLDDLDDEKKLVEILGEFCKQARKEAEVYFDNAWPGGSPARVIGRVTARFVRQGQTADTAIARRLKHLDKEAKNWTVVSSDNQVREAAKRTGARLLSSEEFADLLAGPDDESEDGEMPPSDDDVDEWLSLFANGDDDSG